MSDLVDHYRSTVGQILDQATVGGLRVCLELADGRIVRGTPPRDARDEDRDPETGSLRSLALDGVLVDLDEVRRAAGRPPHHPHPHTAGGEDAHHADRPGGLPALTE